MTDRIAGKTIAPAAIHALKEALALVYWYKSDLRSFLTQSMADPTILSRLNWDDYKRNIVGQLIGFLSSNEDVYQRQLLRLMTDVTRVQDFSHLARLDSGEEKVAQARAAVEALRGQLNQFFHQANGGLVGQATKHDMGHVVELLADGPVQARMIVAMQCAPPGRHPVNQLTAI